MNVFIGKQQATQEADGLRFVHRLQAAYEVNGSTVKGQRFLFLGIISYDNASSYFDRACVEWKHVQHGFEQRGLAAAVGSNDAHTLAVEYGEIKGLKQDASID